MEIFEQSCRTARKDYKCDACRIVFNYFGLNDFSGDDLTIILKAKSNNYKIRKGQKYNIRKYADEGEIFTYRAIPEMDDLCDRHELLDVAYKLLEEGKQ